MEPLDTVICERNCRLPIICKGIESNGRTGKRSVNVFDTAAMSYDIRAMQNWYTAELQIARS